MVSTPGQDGVEHLEALRDHLGADAVAGHHRDADGLTAPLRRPFAANAPPPRLLVLARFSRTLGRRPTLRYGSPTIRDPP